MFISNGAFRVPSILTVLKLQIPEPDIDVVPPKVVLPDVTDKEPLLTRFPLIRQPALPVLTIKVDVTVTSPNVGVELPESVVVPEKVTGLDVSVDAALLTKSPLRSIAFVPALKLPLVRDKVPFTVMLAPEPRVKVPEPVFDKLAKAVTSVGSSGPEVIVPEVYTTLYESVVLLGLVLIEPPDLVIVPPAAMAIPGPLEKVPDVRLRLVIGMLEVVVSVEVALSSVSVPNPVPVNAISEGNVAVVGPSITRVDAVVTESSPGVVGP